LSIESEIINNKLRNNNVHIQNVLGKTGILDNEVTKLKEICNELSNEEKKDISCINREIFNVEKKLVQQIKEIQLHLSSIFGIKFNTNSI